MSCRTNSAPVPTMLPAAITLMILLGGAVQPVVASQLGTPFTVRVTLNKESSGICRSTNQIGTFGAAVTITCDTGLPARYSGDTGQLPWSLSQDGPFRYMTLRSASGELLGRIESHTGKGMTNSWSVVRLNDREYLEFMVSW